MQADFQRHRGTFLLYPSRTDVWRREAVPAQEIVMRLAEAISAFEPVYLGYNVPIARALPSGIKALPMEYDDIWVRDTGALPLNGGGYVRLQFNAWGGADGLYSDWQNDLRVPQRMAEILRADLSACDITAEGGNLTADGESTLVAVRACLVCENRNPAMDGDSIEKRLKTALRIDKIIWLEEGLEYDETGGHVDNLCAFAAPGKVLLAWTDEPDHPQYKIVRRAYRTLDGETDARGRKLEIIKVPLPDIMFRTEEDCAGLQEKCGSKARPLGEPVQASYINFVFTNGGVIVPQFGTLQDSAALEIFKQTFPERKVIGFSAHEIILGGGGLHCITRNV